MGHILDPFGKGECEPKRDTSHGVVAVVVVVVVVEIVTVVPVAVFVDDDDDDNNDDDDCDETEPDLLGEEGVRTNTLCSVRYER